MDEIPELLFLDFKCPYCGGTVSFPETSIATLQDCPACLEILIVPPKGSELGIKLPIPFNTSRLLLRRLVPTDSGELLELMSDEEGFRHIGWNPMELGELEIWLESVQLNRLTQPDNRLFLALELLQSKRVIGFVSLGYLDEQRQQMEYFIMINSQYRRQRLGTEAVEAVLKLMLKNFSAYRVAVWCDARNIPCIRLLERTRFRKEGQGLKDKFQKAEWIDSCYYALLREEYI